MFVHADPFRPALPLPPGLAPARSPQHKQDAALQALTQAVDEIADPQVRTMIARVGLAGVIDEMKNAFAPESKALFFGAWTSECTRRCVLALPPEGWETGL